MADFEEAFPVYYNEDGQRQLRIWGLLLKQMFSKSSKPWSER